MEGKLAILGTGTMGEALLDGLLRTGTLTADQAVCTVRRRQRAETLAERHGVETTVDNRSAIEAADVVLMALKPQVLPDVLGEVGDAFRDGQLVISIAAGVTIAGIEARIPAAVAAVRVMTNTPAQVGEAMSVLAAGTRAGGDELGVVEELLGVVGPTLRLEERHLHAVTALSGSGPAYLFLVVEAMIDAGVMLGLSREVSTRLAVQTAVGSAAMLRDTEHGATRLREMVSSPGGTTVAGLRELEAGGLRTALSDAVEAAHRRSRELGGEG